MKKQILSLISLIVGNYRISDREVIVNICDLLVDQVSSTKMLFDQFEHSGVVMWCLRIMIVLSKRRQLVIN